MDLWFHFHPIPYNISHYRRKRYCPVPIFSNETSVIPSCIDVVIQTVSEWGEPLIIPLTFTESNFRVPISRKKFLSSCNFRMIRYGFCHGYGNTYSHCVHQCSLCLSVVESSLRPLEFQSFCMSFVITFTYLSLFDALLTFIFWT